MISCFISSPQRSSVVKTQLLFNASASILAPESPIMFPDDIVVFPFQISFLFFHLMKINYSTEPVQPTYDYVSMLHSTWSLQSLQHRILFIHPPRQSSPSFVICQTLTTPQMQCLQCKITFQCFTDHCSSFISNGHYSIIFFPIHSRILQSFQTKTSLQLRSNSVKELLNANASLNILHASPFTPETTTRLSHTKRKIIFRLRRVQTVKTQHFSWSYISFEQG